MFILATNIVIPSLKKRHKAIKSYFNQVYESLFRSCSDLKQRSVSNKSNGNNSYSIEHRLNCIKDTLNFNLCSQSDLVKIIQDIQQMKKVYPQREKFTLAYNKMMFKTILQEKEDGKILQLFSEFEYLNEILDKEEITLNIEQLEIDYLFDERLETYYTYQINAEQNYLNRHNLIDNYIYNPQNQQQHQQQQQYQQQHPNNEQKQKQLDIQDSKQDCILPSIYIHKQLFVQFISFQNYNFQQFSFGCNSNLEYTQALLIQNQPYLNNSNALNISLPNNIIVFHSKSEFNIYIRTFLTLLMYIKVFNQKICPHINYLKEYTLMDILLDD